METLFFILVASSLDIIKSSNGLSAESDSQHEKSYKVHPESDDMEKSETFVSTYATDFNRIKVNNVTTEDISNYQYDDQNALKNENADFYEEKSHQQPFRNNLIIVPQGSNHVEHHHYKNQITDLGSQGTVYPQKNIENQDEKYASEYSTVVEHYTQGNNDLPPSASDGSVGDIKRLVPKSKVFFKMYHNDKTGNEHKSRYQSNILHQMSDNNHESRSNHKTVSANSVNTNYETNQNGNYYQSFGQPNNYLLPVNQDKQVFQTQTVAQTKFPVYLPADHSQSSPSLGYVPKSNLKNYKMVDQRHLGEIAQPQYKIAAQHNAQHKVERPKIPVTLGQSNALPASSVNNAMHQKTINYFSTPVYVVDNNQRQKFTEHSVPTQPQAYEQPEVIKQMAPTVDYSKKNQYTYAHLRGDKLALSFDAERQNSNVKTLKSSPSIQEQQKYYSVAKKVHPKQQFVAPQVVQPSLRINVAERPTPNQVSPIIQGTMPVKTEEYIRKYQNDVAEIQNAWKTFSQATYNQASQTKSPLITKYPEKMHFEVNPIVDVNDKKQYSFDHQKALEGSTTFDIKHAIGNEKENNYKTSNLIVPTPEVHQSLENTIEYQTDTIGKPTLLYRSPPLSILPTPMVFLKGHYHPGDTISANSDFEHLTESNIPEIGQKFFAQPQTISVLTDDYFKHGTSAFVQNDFPHPLLKFHLPYEKGTFKNFKMTTPQLAFSTQGKHSIKPVREINQDVLIQYSKKIPKYVVHPIKKIVTEDQDEWNANGFKLKTGNKILIKPEAMPYINDFGKKYFPVFVKKIPGRRGIKGNIVMGTNARQDQNFQVDLLPESSHNLVKTHPKNEFSVSASYQIDRSYKMDESNSKQHKK